MVKVIEEAFGAVKLIELDVFGDERGFFCERYHKEKFADLGINQDFIQDNHSRSAPGILRGLHYQVNPAQAKLVGCITGKIFDVAVDLRENSETYGQYYAAELSAENAQLLLVPAGFAHGFYVIGDEPANVTYKVDGIYNPAGDGGIIYNDPDIGIKWPGNEFLLSEKDKNLQSFEEYRQNPLFKV
jgi:dTDP-4-dehydrorhamnose 3,5-epimerase